MNYIKNLMKILLFAQCLLFYACDKKETEIIEIKITEQNILNLADFVKCPFNEEFKKNTNLEKYVIKKFGKPDEFGKGRDTLGNAVVADIIIDEIWLKYSEKMPGDIYSFRIYRGVSKRFEVFAGIYINKFTDLKYGFNEETTIKDIDNLFGKPKEHGIKRKGNDIKQYYYCYSNDGPYVYHLYIRFTDEKLDSIDINTNGIGL